jgi:hypothetical protein
MVLETWVIALVVLITGDRFYGLDVSILRLFRLFRLTRVARMARLLRVMPELMILVKGISGAARAVFFTLCLLLFIIYVFAIAFKQLTHGTSVGDRYFRDVLTSIATLLLQGTLPDLANIVYAIREEHILLSGFFLFFILLATLMLMNMLVGVLVEVVSTVSSVEKEQLEARFLKVHMNKLLNKLDEDSDHCISIDEFDTLLEKPKAIKALKDVGVDVLGLVELRDFFFREQKSLTFPDFLELVLQLRGTNTATVKNIVDMRMFMTTELNRVEDRLVNKLEVRLMNGSSSSALAVPAVNSPQRVYR